MARSTRKLLAGTAASAARKVISRSASAKPAPTTRTTGKGAATTTGSKPSAAVAAPAKKVTAKKVTAKKVTAKKVTAKKVTAKKVTANQGAAKKAAAKQGTAKPDTAKKAATKKAAPARSASTKATPAKPAGAKKPAAARPAAKKTTTKATKAASANKVGALKVKEGEGAWTKAEIKEVLDELHDLRARVVRTLAEQEEELAHLMRDAGDGAGQDQADMGATSFERDHELSVVNNEREKLAQIDRALARIADGTYGVCESCGNPIGKMRAMAFPRATLCLTCKQREERR